MTRSKAWVRVSGIGDDMDLLIQEFNSVKERNFQLEFTYPDKSQRKNMRIIHRDMTQNELRDIRKSNLIWRILPVNLQMEKFEKKI